MSRANGLSMRQLNDSVSRLLSGNFTETSVRFSSSPCGTNCRSVRTKFHTLRGSVVRVRLDQLVERQLIRPDVAADGELARSASLGYVQLHQRRPRRRDELPAIQEGHVLGSDREAAALRRDGGSVAGERGTGSAVGRRVLHVDAQQ